MTSRSELRAQVRRRRHALDPSTRRACARRLTATVLTSNVLTRSGRVACYIAQDGEMDLSPLISRLWSMGKRTYLPGLHGQELWFLPYTRYTPLCRNRFGIPEPDAPPRSRCLRQALDLVLMPLVAFDESGNRLGMGGGYYDRTFAYLLNRRRWRRPMLLGVAYEFQCVESLPTRHWDVPLDGVVTDKRVRLFSQRLEADD